MSWSNRSIVVKWTQERNWLKYQVMGNLTRAQNALHQAAHCLSEAEKLKMDKVLDLIKEINDDWREEQALMVRAMKAKTS